MEHYFNEKEKEYSPKRKEDIPVFQTPKFRETRKKAIEVIESGKYDLTDGDFWILMNETKNGKMAYTGLITSHNACLKINDALQDRFRPECVTVDKDGYNGSLVYSYCCPEQGLYEVGEASPDNCKNAYPYAMAYKRLFDRVVLKLSRLAYSGVYSEAEADEFREPQTKAEEFYVSETMIRTIKNEMERTGVTEKQICDRYKVKSMLMLPAASYISLMNDLKKTPAKEEKCDSVES